MSDRAPRQRNDGLRKVCGCARAKWPKCPHGWRMNFKWKGVHHRYALDRLLAPRKVRAKTEADGEAENIRTAIREGTFRAPGQVDDAPVRETLTLSQLLALYRKRCLLPRLFPGGEVLTDPGAARERELLSKADSQIRIISRTELDRPDGERRAMGAWLVCDVTTDTIEQFQAVRSVKTWVAANRDLGLLRAMFNWAVRKKLVTETPFKIGTEPVIKLRKERARRRRLQPGEGDRLLAACGPHLRACVEAAIATGMRKGELLSLQWWQVQSEPRPQIYLPAVKTKTRDDRWIPISGRLQLILDMRRCDPDGQEHPPTAYVFGDAVGHPAKSFKRAWERAVLVAHGHTPEYVMKPRSEGLKPLATAVLTSASRALLTAVDLNFHDLRREAGSRWLEGGVPLHTVRDWLGHTSVAQTSVYLAGTLEGQHDAMKTFEKHQGRVQRSATKAGTRGQKGAPKVIAQNRKSLLSSARHH